VVGVTYARLLPNASPETNANPTADVRNDAPANPVRNVSTMSATELADIPPEALHPHPPEPAGFNASRGGLPPGALPPGVVLPGITEPIAPPPQGYGVYDGVRQ